jgi:hypothetical protein
MYTLTIYKDFAKIPKRVRKSLPSNEPILKNLEYPEFKIGKKICDTVINELTLSEAYKALYDFLIPYMPKDPRHPPLEFQGALFGFEWVSWGKGTKNHSILNRFYAELHKTESVISDSAIRHLNATERKLRK